MTNVIFSQCSALKSLGIRPLLIVGHAGEYSSASQQTEIWPELKYLPDHLNSDKIHQKLIRLRRRFSTELDPRRDRLHIHNLNLGKNPLLNVVVWEWLKSGGQLINHCHDFAEDKRPKNLGLLNKVITETLGLNYEEVMYPKNYACRYVVINGYDRQRLLDHNVPNQEIFDCHNAVGPVPEYHQPSSRETLCRQLELDPSHKIFTYPVRAIQRKNIGEFIFLAALFHDKAQFIITQAPKNPSEQKLYQSWVDYCRDCELPITFEAGDKMDFHDIMAGTDAVITTSTQEGFGMVFLEPWLWKKMVFGRDLPDVTSTFKQKGLDLSCLYEDVIVDGVSFPEYNVDGQRKLISKCLSDSTWRQACIEVNHLEPLLEVHDPKKIIRQQQHIKENYSISAYADSLANIYATFI